MTDSQILETTNKIFQAIFGQDNPYDIQKLKDKFAFDIALPTKVKDFITGEVTYTAMPNAKKFITDANTHKRDKNGWMLPKRRFNSLKDIIAAWEEINYTTTERVYDSDNVSCSDPIYGSQNIYCSTNCGQSKNLIYCDGTFRSSFSIACQRSNNVNFCICADDSDACTNSYNVICSGKISNSMFIQDCGSLHECIFCSHISNHEYCIANTEFSEEEYFYLKQQIIRWILSDAIK